MMMRGSRPVTRTWAAFYICQNIPWLWLFVTRSSHQARVDHPMVRAQLRAVSPRISAACVTSTRHSQTCSSVWSLSGLYAALRTHTEMDREGSPLPSQLSPDPSVLISESFIHCLWCIGQCLLLSNSGLAFTASLNFFCHSVHLDNNGHD